MLPNLFLSKQKVLFKEAGVLIQQKYDENETKNVS